MNSLMQVQRDVNNLYNFVYERVVKNFQKNLEFLSLNSRKKLESTRVWSTRTILSNWFLLAIINRLVFCLSPQTEKLTSLNFTGGECKSLLYIYTKTRVLGFTRMIKNIIYF